MNYPKYFTSHHYDTRLYVITSEKTGYSTDTAGKRGSMNWPLSEMTKKNGFKPATAAQIRRFIPDYQPAPRIDYYRLKGGFGGVVAYFIVKDGKVTRVLKDGTEEAAEEDFSLPTILGWVNSGVWEKVSLHEARKVLIKTPPKPPALKTTLSKLAASEARCAALTEENLRLKAIIAASKKELEKA